MSGAWQAISSFFSDVTTRKTVLPPRIPIVALGVPALDRNVLTSVSAREPLDVHFAESAEEAYAAAKQWTAPVVLLDRDWAGPAWRVNVQILAELPHRACVVLISGVSDDYLLQELVRRGGHEVLLKPLLADDVVRVVNLAASYWNSARRFTALPRNA